MTRTGMHAVKVAPRPLPALKAVTSPPRARAKVRLMCSPRPVPPPSLAGARSKGRKTRLHSSWVRPTPWSETSSRSTSSLPARSMRALTRTSEPLANLMALPTRFCVICCRCNRSPSTRSGSGVASSSHTRSLMRSARPRRHICRMSRTIWRMENVLRVRETSPASILCIWQSSQRPERASETAIAAPHRQCSYAPTPCADRQRKRAHLHHVRDEAVQQAARRLHRVGQEQSLFVLLHRKVLEEQ